MSASVTDCSITDYYVCVSERESAYIEELMQWIPDDAVVHRHVDDVRLTVHVLSSLRQKTHPDLYNRSSSSSD